MNLFKDVTKEFCYRGWWKAFVTVTGTNYE